MLIGFVTDFGSRGMHYVTEMKGIALKISKDVQFMDVMHHITPFSIIETNYVLQTVYHTLPVGTIFVCVVDPGVGTSRNIILFSTHDGYYFVGPDNGIFTYFQKHKLIARAVIITNQKFYHPKFQELINRPNSIHTHTFHGRDIMSPVAAFLSTGVAMSEFGKEIHDIDTLSSISLPTDTNPDENGEWKAIIQYIDKFGNIITTISISDFLKNFKIEKDQLQVKIGNQTNNLYYSVTFSPFTSQELLFIPGSSGVMEICQNRHFAAQTLNVHVGDSISVIIIKEEV